jgi:dTDP-4-dehydrorhamnose 3,5-epimerase
MVVENTAIPDVKLITPAKFGDTRGFFSETYSRKKLAEQGIAGEFVQDNHSMSARPGVVRGLHYQLAPMAQAKLVRCVKGKILDVVVDIRRGSPTFGRVVREIISAENWKQIFVPVGFAHGFSVLEPDTEVIYKVTADYSPAHERGIAWNDPALAIDWQVQLDQVVLSEKDKKNPLLKDATELF